MDELRKALDDEARRVRADAQALDGVRARAHRRRITRQVGSGVAALAIAGAGFAVAFGAFQGPDGFPKAGPTSSISPSPSRSPAPLVLVVGLEGRKAQTGELSDRLQEAGYQVDTVYCAGCPLPEHTLLEYKPEYLAEATTIRQDVLPGALLEPVAWPDNKPDIQVTLGADYLQLVNSAVRVRVLDAGAGLGTTDAAADMLAAAGYDVVEVGEASSVYDETIVACFVGHDEEGFRILREFFPGADFRGEVPSEDHDVTVYIGPDYQATEPPAAGDVQAFIDAFVFERGSGGNAQKFLAESAYGSFYETDDDDQLGSEEWFLYPDGEISDHRVALLEYGDGAWTAEVRMTIQPRANCPSFTVTERWRIGSAAAAEGVEGLVVLESEFLGSNEPICPAANQSGG